MEETSLSIGREMGIPKDILRNEPRLSSQNVMTCYRGSISHGMYVPGPDSIDDKDVMAVYIPDKSFYFGTSRYGARAGKKGTKEIKRDEWDIVCYEFLKMMHLLWKGNPNVLMTLWLDDNYYLNKTATWEKVLENRDIFVGKHVYRSFSGYAYGQLHRMTHHTKEGYMGQKRLELVQRFGYDTKNAAHLIRLLRMAIEFLNDGRLYVTRHDAQQLLEIKKGEWTLEQVKSEADRLFALTEEAYLKSKLPVESDRERVDELCVEILTSELSMS